MARKLFFIVFFTSMFTFSMISYATQNDTENDINRITAMIPEQEFIQLASGKQVTAEIKTSEQYRDGLAAYIRKVNRQVSRNESEVIADSVLESAEKYDVDEKLVMAIAQTESTYYSDAVSCADYKGLMQTGDVLAKEAGYTPQQLFNPAVSIDVGTSYIDEKLDEFGDLTLALTAYNQGAGTVYSGNYSTDYAELALSRMTDVEQFLTKNGYVNVYN